MRNWLANNIQMIIYLLAFLLPVASKGLSVLIEKRREAEAQRMRGGSPSPQPVERPALRRTPDVAQNRDPDTIQAELAAQRKAQIEMWKAREAMLSGQRVDAAGAARPSAEDELARRRRLAMEELRRRKVAAEPPRPSPQRSTPQPAQIPQTAARRGKAAAAEQRRSAGKRRGTLVLESTGRPTQMDRASIAAPVIDQRIAEPLPQRPPAVVPGSRTAGVGSVVLTRESLRRAFIMKELLDPPVALRNNPAGASAGYHLPF
jgi:hypothetical protein